jgi:hypothetical protein
MVTLAELQLRVDNAVDMLKEVDPEWFTCIDLEDFDLSSGHYCVLGQWDTCRQPDSFGNGSYDHALKTLDLSYPQAKDFGFEGMYIWVEGVKDDDGDTMGDWECLSIIWIERIKALQEAHNAVPV